MLVHISQAGIELGLNQPETNFHEVFSSDCLKIQFEMDELQC